MQKSKDYIGSIFENCTYSTGKTYKPPEPDPHEEKNLFMARLKLVLKDYSPQGVNPLNQGLAEGKDVTGFRDYYFIAKNSQNEYFICYIFNIAYKIEDDQGEDKLIFHILYSVFKFELGKVLELVKCEIIITNSDFQLDKMEILPYRVLVLHFKEYFFHDRDSDEEKPIVNSYSQTLFLEEDMSLKLLKCHKPTLEEGYKFVSKVYWFDRHPFKETRLANKKNDMQEYLGIWTQFIVPKTEGIN